MSVESSDGQWQFTFTERVTTHEAYKSDSLAVLLIQYRYYYKYCQIIIFF